VTASGLLVAGTSSDAGKSLVTLDVRVKVANWAYLLQQRS
jgi:hypothetical protein